MTNSNSEHLDLKPDVFEPVFRIRKLQIISIIFHCQGFFVLRSWKAFLIYYKIFQRMAIIQMFSIFINGFPEHFCQWKEEILLEDKKSKFWLQ